MKASRNEASPSSVTTDTAAEVDSHPLMYPTATPSIATCAESNNIKQHNLRSCPQVCPIGVDKHNEHSVRAATLDPSTLEAQENMLSSIYDSNESVRINHLGPNHAYHSSADLSDGDDEYTSQQQYREQNDEEDNDSIAHGGDFLHTYDQPLPLDLADFDLDDFESKLDHVCEVERWKPDPPGPSNVMNDDGIGTLPNLHGVLKLTDDEHDPIFTHFRDVSSMDVHMLHIDDERDSNNRADDEPGPILSESDLHALHNSYMVDTSTNDSDMESTVAPDDCSQDSATSAAAKEAIDEGMLKLQQCMARSALTRRMVGTICQHSMETVSAPMTTKDPDVPNEISLDVCDGTTPTQDNHDATSGDDSLVDMLEACLSGSGGDVSHVLYPEPQCANSGSSDLATINTRNCSDGQGRSYHRRSSMIGIMGNGGPIHDPHTNRQLRSRSMDKINRPGKSRARSRDKLPARGTITSRRSASSRLTRSLSRERLIRAPTRGAGGSHMVVGGSIRRSRSSERLFRSTSKSSPLSIQDSTAMLLGKSAEYEDQNEESALIPGHEGDDSFAPGQAGDDYQTPISDFLKTGGPLLHRHSVVSSTSTAVCSSSVPPSPSVLRSSSERNVFEAHGGDHGEVCHRADTTCGTRSHDQHQDHHCEESENTDESVDGVTMMLMAPAQVDECPGVTI